MKYFIVGLHSSGKQEILDILSKYEVPCGKLFSNISEPRAEIYNSFNYELYTDKDIKDIFERTGVNPANITFEITESFAITDINRVMEIINGLRSIGPKIALDDFGTGYSSLNYIKQLPLDLIKVDKTFIDDIIEDEYAQAFIKLIIGLAKTIGTKVIVEGVETPEQSEVLKNLGVSFIQGYLYGKPVPSEEFERLYLHVRK